MLLIEDYSLYIMPSSTTHLGCVRKRHSGTFECRSVLLSQWTLNRDRMILWWYSSDVSERNLNSIFNTYFEVTSPVLRASRTIKDTFYFLIYTDHRVN